MRIPSILKAAETAALILRTTRTVRWALILGSWLALGSFSGADDESDPISLHLQFGNLYYAGKFREAIPIAEKALDLREKEFGVDHPDTAGTLNNLAEVCKLTGDYTRAELLYQRVLRIKEKAYGPENPALGSSLNGLADLYRLKADYGNAEPLLKRALAIYEKAFGENHPETARTLNTLGLLYTAMADYAGAELFLNRALAICKTLRPHHSSTAAVLNNLGLLYGAMGNYTQTEAVLLEGLAISETALGPNDPDTAKSVSSLGTFYDSMRNYAKAEPFLKRALAIDENVFGENHVATARDLNNLAELYRSMGEFAKAEPLLKRALAAKERALGQMHPDTATSISNLAVFYSALGDYAKAEQFAKQALAIDERACGLSHPTTAIRLSNLAWIYMQTGDYDRSEQLLQRALTIRKEMLDPNHQDIARSLNALATCYKNRRNFAVAELLYIEALAICEKGLGPNHPFTATCLNNTALLYEAMGDYSKAEQMLEQALTISEQALGPNHPEIASGLANLAIVAFDRGGFEGARRWSQRSAKMDEIVLGNILSFTSEQQRLTYQTQIDPFWLPATLGEAADIAQTILHNKGVILDSVMEDRLTAEAGKDAKQREIIDHLRAAKERFSQLLMEIPNDLSEEARRLRETELENRAKQVEQLESTMARHVTGLGRARRALTVTVSQVQGTLASSDQVLVDFLRYNHYLGKNRWEPRYGAVLIASSGEPQWVPLGSAAEIEKNVLRYGNEVRSRDTDEQTLAATLHALNAMIWTPIAQVLPGKTRTVIISPDAKLNFVSFATLLDGDQFLAEKYAFRYVSSGRDLLREVKRTTSTEVLVLANPNFNEKPDQLVAQMSATRGAFLGNEKRSFEDQEFAQLKNTQREVAGLSAKFEQWKWSTRSLTRSEASKEALLKVESPFILHLATHGFLVEPESKPVNVPMSEMASPIATDFTAGRRKFFENPMHYSGLALAGAQLTLEAWRRGETPSRENDGIVTAEDVSTLNLNGTWLVTLSACETGLGEAKAGEGVLGLRRGFVQAGAENLLMTLWKIDDQATVDIMLDFYEAAHKSGNAPQAVADVQRDWLVRLRQKEGLLRAVNLAGPFIMSSQGKP